MRLIHAPTSPLKPALTLTRGTRPGDLCTTDGPPLRISFVLPGRGHAGGTRVTAAMASEMLDRGHHVRILHRRRRLNITDPVDVFRVWKDHYLSLAGTDWLRTFPGEIQAYDDLNDLAFDRGELVIAIGAYVVEDVHSLEAEVIKVRWCHGFSEHLGELMQRAWSVPMPTLAVSPRLVPRLEAISQSPVLAVVPNGIHHHEYHNEHRRRDGVGAVFSQNWKKAPEVLLETVTQIRKAAPRIRRYVFGGPARPRPILRRSYWRLPPIPKARELYNRSRVWVVASRSEGFCLPILEAMACGAAVVSTDHDTASGLIRDGENGLLVPVDDPDALAEAALDLFEDHERRRRLVRNGYRTAARMNWPGAADRLEHTLRQLAPTPVA